MLLASVHAADMTDSDVNTLDMDADEMRACGSMQCGATAMQNIGAAYMYHVLLYKGQRSNTVNNRMCMLVYLAYRTPVLCLMRDGIVRL